MMKLFRPGGTISVFLVIILVPCLVVCFLFVDLSRVELSQSSVESTADTTLNSLISGGASTATGTGYEQSISDSTGTATGTSYEQSISGTTDARDGRNAG